MKKIKTIVIGNSAIGKSTCVNKLAKNPVTASMDESLSGGYPGLDATLKWIFEKTDGESILAAFSHEDFLWDLARAKKSRDFRLNSLLLIFLYNSIPGVRYQRLKDSNRTPDDSMQHASWDAMVNDLCRFSADISINTATMTPDEVASIVKAVSDSQLTR